MKRVWKRIIIAAVLLVAVAILAPAIFVLRYSGGARGLGKELARIRSDSAPTCAADLAGSPIPDSENAAILYQKCFDCLPKSTDAGGGNVLADFLDPERREGDPKLWTQARTMVDRCAPALSLAGKAAAMPQCRYPVDWKKGVSAALMHLPSVRQLVRLLAVQALLDAKDGKMIATARDLRLLYTVSDSLRDEPSLVNQLVRYACLRTASSTLCQSAGLGRIGEGDARALSAAIGGIGLGDGFKQALLGERAMGITLFDDMHNGRFPLSEHPGDEPLMKRFYATAPGSVCLDNDESYFLKEMGRFTANASMPYRVLRARNLDRASDVPRYARFSAIILPDYDSMVSHRDRAAADLAGSRIFLGLLAYHDRFHSYPASLGELSKLNWQLPKDPFSGKPFVYRRQGKGFILYSIGDDLKDNGGIAPKGIVPGDIVWKLTY